MRYCYVNFNCLEIGTCCKEKYDQQVTLFIATEEVWIYYGLVSFTDWYCQRRKNVLDLLPSENKLLVMMTS